MGGRAAGRHGNALKRRGVWAVGAPNGQRAKMGGQKNQGVVYIACYDHNTVLLYCTVLHCTVLHCITGH